jgi:hypothetical protein
MVQSGILSKYVCLERFHNHCENQNSIIIIVIRLPNCCLVLRRRQMIFLYYKLSWPSLGLKQLQWISGALSPGYNNPGMKVITHIYWHVYVLGQGYFVWPWSPHRHRTFRDVRPGPLTVTDTCIMYHLKNFEAFQNVILHMRYVSTCVGARVVGVEKQWTNAIRCGACYYSIVVNAHRVTSIADTDIDAVRKQKKAEYDKQYRLKRKVLLQQQASKFSEEFTNNRS